MPRRAQLPDPNDRSPNSPITIVPQAAVLDIHNREHPDDRRQRVNDTVKERFIKIAQDASWKEVKFAGNQATLEADVVLRERKP